MDAVFVIPYTCFVCFITAAVISENSDYIDTCTSIFLFLGLVFSLVCFVYTLQEVIK